jgi:hypothetical protein
LFKVEALLREAFPNPPLHWAELENCLVNEAVSGRADSRRDDAIEVVQHWGGRSGLISRLREEHPIGRPHDEQFDVGLANAFVECEAFAWAAEVAALGVPRFLPRAKRKTPDIEIPGWGWVEGKSIGISESDRDVWRTAYATARQRGSRFPTVIGKPSLADERFYQKVDSAAKNAVGQWEAVGGSAGGNLALFLHVALDSNVFDDHVWDNLGSWADGFAAATHARVVICYNFSWRGPRVDVGFV